MRSLRSPEIRAKFKAYADSARASRSAARSNPVVSPQKAVNTDPFQNQGIMNAVNLHILANLSLAKAAELPELKNSDQSTVERLARSAMRNTRRLY